MRGYLECQNPNPLSTDGLTNHHPTPQNQLHSPLNTEKWPDDPHHLHTQLKSQKTTLHSNTQAGLDVGWSTGWPSDLCIYCWAESQASTGWRESERLLGRSIDELSGEIRMVCSHWSGFMPRTHLQQKENGNALGDAATETQQLAAQRLIKLHTHSACLPWGFWPLDHSHTLSRSVPRGSTPQPT
ncbi:hypothetical protein O181_081610 [Austropuccinia psidii MF-1]|uniref:Uncharacterized protein n=1 Tax=Austropuccinia psidii MF-1 TaxID=1389203 RepID=A0A9Q3FQD2_9BASI|nr:hypothetical protein [Austropuccinia psidii MF-1]